MISKEILEQAYAHTIKRPGQYVIQSDFCSVLNSLSPGAGITPEMLPGLFAGYDGVKFLDDYVLKDAPDAASTRPTRPTRAMRVNPSKKEFGWTRLDGLRSLILVALGDAPTHEGFEADRLLEKWPETGSLLKSLGFGSLEEYVATEPHVIRTGRSASGKVALFRILDPVMQKQALKTMTLPPVESLPAGKVAEFRKTVSDIYSRVVAEGRRPLLTNFSAIKPLAAELLGIDKVKPAIEHLTADIFTLVDDAEPGHPAVWRLVKKKSESGRQRKVEPSGNKNKGLLWVYTIDGRRVMDPLPVVAVVPENPETKPEAPKYTFGAARNAEKTEKPEKSEHKPAAKPEQPGRKLNAHGKFMAFSTFAKRYQEVIKELAAKALREDWCFDRADADSMPILRNYLELTFERLQYEDSKGGAKIKVSDDGKYAVFNTGLVDDLYDPIYAFFARNTNERFVQTWFFLRFTTANERAGQDMVRVFGSALPEPASYYTSPSELVYDVRLSIATIHIDHIIERAFRLPIDFLTQTVAGFDFNRLHDADFFRELTAYINGNRKIKYALKSRVEEAVKMAVKKVGWNFKTAVPIYYPERRKISLLLPLVLGNADDRPDVALVLEATPGGYIAHTVLTMKQAFTNARLVSRPDYQWLAIDKIAGPGAAVDPDTPPV